MMDKVFPVLGTLILMCTAYISGGYALESYRASISTQRDIEQVPLPDNEWQPTGISLPKQRPEVFYAAITDRPVFEPTRRPVSTAPAQIATEPETAPETGRNPSPLPQLELLGVIRSSQSSSALLSVDGGAALWIKEGEMVSKWQV